MIKSLIKRISVKRLAASYDGYADFARHASKTEKQRVIKDSINKANKMQRATANSHNRT